MTLVTPRSKYVEYLGNNEPKLKKRKRDLADHFAFSEAANYATTQWIDGTTKAAELAANRYQEAVMAHKVKLAEHTFSTIKVNDKKEIPVTRYLSDHILQGLREQRYTMSEDDGVFWVFFDNGGTAKFPETFEKFERCQSILESGNLRKTIEREAEDSPALKECLKKWDEMYAYFVEKRDNVFGHRCRNYRMASAYTALAGQLSLLKDHVKPQSWASGVITKTEGYNEQDLDNLEQNLSLGDKDARREVVIKKVQECIKFAAILNLAENQDADWVKRFFVEENLSPNSFGITQLRGLNDGLLTQQDYMALWLTLHAEDIKQPWMRFASITPEQGPFLTYKDDLTSLPQMKSPIRITLEDLQHRLPEVARKLTRGCYTAVLDFEFPEDLVEKLDDFLKRELGSGRQIDNDVDAFFGAQHMMPPAFGLQVQWEPSRVPGQEVHALRAGQKNTEELVTR